MFHPRIFKAALWLVPIMAITLSPLRAQENAKSEKQEKAGHGRQNVTGCLQKGDEPGGFTLTGDDGKVWELTSSSDVNLADHVGHKVTVSGAVMPESKEHEAKMEAHEKKEAGGKDYDDLKVNKLEMVSDSCK